MCPFFYFRFLNDAAKVVLGRSTAPETTLYNAVADTWLTIDTSAREYLPRTSEFDDLISFGKSYLASTKDRGDYKELMALSLLLLDAYPADLPPYHIRSVGGTSSAQWMAKVIYELKIVLFKSQFVRAGLITNDEAEEHTALVKFLLKYYIHRWLQCPGAEDAAVNDLGLYQELSKVKSTSPEYKFAKPMLDKVDQHLWFLSEELVVFAFFSSLLTNAEKALCAKAMKRYFKKGDCATPDGKLTTPLLSKSTKLWHLFGPKSWLIFHLLDFDRRGRSFLDKPVRDWPQDQDYKYLQGIIANMQVVNDPAERGILLAKTLQGKVALNEGERKKLFLIIPHLREKLKRLTKSNILSFSV